MDLFMSLFAQSTPVELVCLSTELKDSHSPIRLITVGKLLPTLII